MIRTLCGRRWRWLTLLVLAACAGMSGLSVWQLQRLAERRVLNAEAQARLAAPVVELTAADLANAAVIGRRVRVQGRFDASQEITLRNQARRDEPGVHLVTPLRPIAGGRAVLVDRGWIPYDAAPGQFAPPPEATIEGVARASQPRRGWLSPLDTAPAGAARVGAWYRINVAHIQAQVPYELAPFYYVEQTSGFVEGTLPAADFDLAPDDGPHLSYAVQWAAFALTMAIGYGAYVRRTEIAAD